MKKIAICKNCGVQIETVSPDGTVWLHRDPRNDMQNFYAQCRPAKCAEPGDVIRTIDD